MSTDPNKWTNTLPNMHKEAEDEKFNLDHSRWTNTLPKIKNKNPVKKYSFTLIIFIIGFISISVIKNETRELQKEINNLQALINDYKFSLHQSNLDYEVITSPENLSKLAKLHLDVDFSSYKRSQIKILNHEKFSSLKSIERKGNIGKEIQSKALKNLKTKTAKLKKIYSNPDQIPEEIKKQVIKTAKRKKIEMKDLYSNPKSILDSKKVQNWAGIQVVKVFFGIPIIPGK